MIFHTFTERKISEVANREVIMGFSKDFIWGAASAAVQVEGAYLQDGKGLGIWDALSKGHVRHNDTTHTSTDHYHRYKEDIALMKSLGIKAYRFSVSWPRIMPSENMVNEKGLQFYKDLAAECRANGIEPMCTIYHWNMPMWLHEKGGWAYDGISDCFEKFTEIVVKALSDKVSVWMTMNEPMCFIGLGYMMGEHAPFERHYGDEKYYRTTFLKLHKNTLLSHGKAARAIREHAILPPKVGFVLNGNLIMPENETPEEIEKARKATFSKDAYFANYAFWADPIILGKIPECEGLTEEDFRKELDDEAMKIIHQKTDFLGYNSYYANNYDDAMKPNPKTKPGMPRTYIGWPITPDALYWNTRFLNERYGVPILITENGMANPDFVMTDGKVHDPQRIEYLKLYLKGAKRAVEEGYPLKGFLYWSIMDNFEWSLGYDMRFGLIHVDYETFKRTPKDSAYWYRDVISSNGENI